MFGLFSVEYALGGPVSVYVMNYFPAHIVQHLILMIVAPAFLAMAAPVTLALQTLPPKPRKVLNRFLHSKFLHIVTFPLVVFTLYYVVMWWFFTTTAIGFAMEHMWVMDLLNLLFFAGGIMFWWPIVGKDTILHWRTGFGGKMITLAIGIPFESFLGIALSGTKIPPAPMYSPHDWYTGGQLLWGLSELLTTLALGIVVANWMSSEDRHNRRMARTSQNDVQISARGDGIPKEFYWAQQIVSKMPPESPVYQEAIAVLKKVEQEHNEGNPLPY
jgi:putative copper resistance protein D